MKHKIEIKTGGRIHFGLCPRAKPDDVTVQRFGGLGVGIESPGYSIEFSYNDQLLIHCRDVSRAHSVVEQWFRQLNNVLGESFAGVSFADVHSMPIAIVERSSIPVHFGLGSGTQFALALVKGLHEFFELPNFDTYEFASILNRGTRSMVGTGVFDQGGLIWDSGTCNLEIGDDSETVVNPVERYPIPSEWRILLAMPRQTSGISGTIEKQRFGLLPPSNDGLACELTEIVMGSILPAVAGKDFPRFAKSVTRYGYLAGLIFESVQGGPYNGRLVSQIIERLKALGAGGIGQSSWGPCVFSWFDNDDSVTRFLNEHQIEFADLADLQIAVPSNNGAKTSMVKTNPIESI